MELEPVSVYEFGPFRLQPVEHLLLADGKPIQLTPKAFDLLVFLVQNQGRLITKDQIMEAIWPESFVEEANITVLVSSLRKVLGGREVDDPYIRTVPKRGYRFIAPVKTETTARTDVGPALTPLDATVTPGLSALEGEAHQEYAPPIPYAEGRAAPFYRVKAAFVLLVLLVCVVAAAAYFVFFRESGRQHSLAVLPLENLTHDPDSNFLGFSLADAIITKLGLLNSVTVRPSSSIEKYRGHEIDIKKVAAELNVDTLLTGNFIRAGDHLRITYQLFDVHTFKILCRDVIDLKYDELLAVHDNVSRQIIAALRLNLTPSESKRIKADAAVNPLAYEYYLRGVDLMASHNFTLAVKMLEKSAELDPKYALTWAYLGQSYTSDATFKLGGREQYRRAQNAYQRALALEPKQVEAEMFYANLLVDTGKVEEAVPLLREAISSNPNNAAVHWELGYAYRFAGMLKQSLAECLRAREMDPLVKSNGSMLNTYLYLGEYDKFIASLPDVNESSFFRFYRGFGEYYQGHWGVAALDLNRAYEEGPTLYTAIGKAFADGLANKGGDGIQLLRELEIQIEQHGVGDPESTYKMAQAYAVLGDRDSSLRMMRSSVESGFFSYPYFLADPLLDNVRSLEAFSRIVDGARQRHEAFKARFF